MTMQDNSNEDLSYTESLENDDFGRLHGVDKYRCTKCGMTWYCTQVRECGMCKPQAATSISSRGSLPRVDSTFSDLRSKLARG